MPGRGNVYEPGGGPYGDMPGGGPDGYEPGGGSDGYEPGGCPYGWTRGLIRSRHQQAVAGRRQPPEPHNLAQDETRVAAIPTNTQVMTGSNLVIELPPLAKSPLPSPADSPSRRLSQRCGTKTERCPPNKSMKSWLMGHLQCTVAHGDVALWPIAPLARCLLLESSGHQAASHPLKITEICCPPRMMVMRHCRPPAAVMRSRSAGLLIFSLLTETTTSPF